MNLVDKIKSLLKDKSVSSDNYSNVNKLEITKSFSPIAKDGGTSQLKIDNSFNTFNGPVYMDNSLQPVNNPVIKGRKKKLRNLMYAGNIEEALEGYLKLQTDVMGDQLSIDDKFYILNGIYNCKVNMKKDNDELKALESKIETLCDAVDYYKYIYLTAIKSYNNHDYKIVISLCDEVNTLNKDYIKSKILKLLAQGIIKDLPYDTVVNNMNLSICKYGGELEDTELADIICAKAELALLLKKLDDAIIFFKEADKKHHSINYQFGIGMAYFMMATLNTTDTGYITFDNVDYDKLFDAISVFENIINESKQNKNTAIIKRMMPYYMNALEIIDEPDKLIDLLSRPEYIIGLDTDELVKSKAYASLKLGRMPSEVSEGLSNIEKLKLEITWLMYKDKYLEVKEKLTGIIETIFRDDEQMRAFYLISLIKTNDKDKFLIKFNEYSKGRQNEVKFKLIWNQYLEHNNQLDEAKNQYGLLLKSNPSKIVVNNAYRFYRRNGYEKEAFKITTNVMENKYTVLRVDLPDFIITHFMTLLHNKNYKEIDRFYSSLDFNKLDTRTKLQVKIEYSIIQGEILHAAELCMKYTELTSDYTVSLKGAICFIKGGNIDTGIKVLTELVNNNKINSSQLFIQLSYAYILKENYDEAFEMAKKAKDYDNNNYKADSHRLFASIAIRVNRVDESVKYMSCFYDEFPKNKWVKPVNIIKKNKMGNDVIDEGVLKSISGDRTLYNQVRKGYFEHNIGLSSYMKFSNETRLDYIFYETQSIKKKIKIASGNVKDINKQAKIIDDTIIVDSLTLFALSKAEMLQILNEFHKVIILYSTIEFIQNLLIENECKVLREVLNYISNQPNVYIKAIKSSIIKSEVGFLDETCHCISYSLAYEIPYLCMDFKVNEILPESSMFIVDISALLKSLIDRKENKRHLYSGYKNKLIKFGFSTISFNAYDIYDLIISLATYDEIEKELEVYLSMDKYSDYESYVNVYIEFLIFIKDVVSEDIYLRCTRKVFHYLNRYLGKIQYYYWCFSLTTNQSYIKESSIKTSNLINEFMKYLSFVEQRKHIVFYKVISQNYNYIKMENIITSILIGLFNLFGRYKDKLDVFNELCDIVRPIMSNVDDRVFKLMLEEAKKYNKYNNFQK